jgi:hypothetical protein
MDYDLQPCLEFRLPLGNSMSFFFFLISTPCCLEGGKSCEPAGMAQWNTDWTRPRSLVSTPNLIFLHMEWIDLLGNEWAAPWENFPLFFVLFGH